MCLYEWQGGLRRFARLTVAVSGHLANRFMKSRGGSPAPGFMCSPPVSADRLGEKQSCSKGDRALGKQRCH